ncbi:MAG: PHP domain-containing protein [Erysipelotrichaceae bacterium]|jgi:predicted metal-dependent phosphoesterase TrpH|nr:PHP domain-containing protein [Erysipelotrichaceae bacterium]
MFYDLHIHSALSPCSNDDMTPNNIVRYAKLCGLDLICVSDHNSFAQQPAVAAVASEHDLKILFGAEIQSVEEVHCLTYFQREADYQAFYQEIEPTLLKIKNDPEYFGRQLIYDAKDEVIDELEWLLSGSCQLSVEALCTLTHQHHGAFVLAHPLRANGIITQLGFVPKDLKLDGMECRNLDQRKEIEASHPWLTDTLWLRNSDAHCLIQIGEEPHEISGAELERLWKNAC